MTVGGWPLTAEAHIGADRSLAYESCFADLSAAGMPSGMHRMVARNPVHRVMRGVASGRVRAPDRTEADTVTFRGCGNEAPSASMAAVAGGCCFRRLVPWSP